MNTKSEFSERLRNAILQAGYPLRPVLVEREFNTRYWGRPVTVQAVRRWLRGEAIPSQDKLQVLAEWLKVEPHLLRFGEEAVRSVQMKKEVWEKGVGYEEREAFEAFLALPLQQRKVVREVIMAFASAYPPTEEQNARPARKRQPA